MTFSFVTVLLQDLFIHWPQDYLVLKYISKMKWKYEYAEQLVLHISRAVNDWAFLLG